MFTGLKTDFDGGVVCEIGCGPFGGMLPLVEAKVKYAIDPLINEYLSVEHDLEGMKLIAACGEEIPLADESVDACYCINTLDHMYNPSRALQEIYRILKPGGYFAFAVDIGGTPKHPLVIYEKDLDEYLTASNYDILEKKCGTNIPSTWPASMKIPLYVFQGTKKGLRTGLTADSERYGETTVINISKDNVLADFRRLKESASKNRYGNWQVRWGDITIYCQDLLSFYMMAKDIFLHRIYDFEAGSDSPVVIDGGGYLGLFTIYIKRKYPNARVTVFEPDRESLKLLYKNLKANSISDVKVVEAGLFKENCEIPFSCNNLDGSSIFYNDKNGVIPVVRLSEYIGPGIDFLKLNIEGAELDVIEEIKPHLGKIKELVIEYHGFPETGQRLHRILSVLDEAGFKYMLHDFDTESNPSSKPPFRLHEKSRYFLLIYAKKMFSPSVTSGVKNNSIKSGLLVEPVSRKFGFDRGMPIDRYYIEKFLNNNRQSIRGRVMEVAGNNYTLKFGSGVTQSEILNTVKTTAATMVGDLTDEAAVPQEAFDCIILTQTLQFIYDFKTALKTAIRALKPGGTLLLTASGISQISRYDMDRWGEYWRFTDECLKKLLSEYVSEQAVNIEAWGNVAVAKAFLDGLAAEEIDKETLEFRDNDYQVVLTARVCKPLSQKIGISIGGTLSRHEPVLKSPLVLLYHRIADDELDSQLLTVSPENFEGHLKELKEKYRVVSLYALIQEISKGRLNSDTIAITFDDGYLDNLTNGMPLLEKYELPATIFITSGMVGSNEEFWWDAMERIFLTGLKLPESLNIRDSQGVLNWPLGNAEERLKAYEELCGMFRQLAVSKINEIVGQLFLWAGITSSGRITHRVVDAEQLGKLAMSGVIEIGSHTISHTKLSILSSQEQKYEIIGSKQQLEPIIHKPVRLVSYPYGTRDSFTKGTADIVASAGFAGGIANIQGNVTNPVDIYALPRRLVRNWSPDVFAQWLRDDNKGALEAETISKRVEKIIRYQLRHKSDLIKAVQES
jgi:FkbM family methyltransferase